MDEPVILKLAVPGLQTTALTSGDGPVVLCLHGFPDHALSYRHQLPILAAAGYRAVAPTMRGYEPSSQPGPEASHYHPVRLAHDVIAWARELDNGPVHLVGHDWGAAVGYLAAALEPKRFRTLTTIAVPPLQALQDGLWKHPGQLARSWYMFFFQLRGIADHVVQRDDLAFLERLWRSWSPGWSWDPADMAELKQTFRRPGVVGAALGYYRATFDPFLAETREMWRLARRPIEVPTLAITGATDGCIDTRLYDVIDPGLFPCGLRVERVAGAGHFAHQEEPGIVNRLLLDWLGAGGSGARA